MTCRIALLRHGKTAWNRNHRIQGRTDIPLDEAARAELRGLQLPTPWNLAPQVSSPLLRACETSEILSGATPICDAALTEMDWGEWEGLKGTDLRADPHSGFLDIEDWGWAFHPPQGESPADLRDRLVPWLDQQAGDIVAVCHIGVMRVLLALAWDWDFQGPCPFSIKRNRLFVISRTIDGWVPDPTPIRLVERVT